MTYWPFRAWARRSGERICSSAHDKASIRRGQPCPTCKAVV